MVSVLPPVLKFPWIESWLPELLSQVCVPPKPSELENVSAPAPASISMPVDGLPLTVLALSLKAPPVTATVPEPVLQTPPTAKVAARFGSDVYEAALNNPISAPVGTVPPQLAGVPQFVPALAH